MKKIVTVTFLTVSSLLFSCKKELSHTSEQQLSPSATSSLRTTTSSNLLWQKCFGTAGNEIGYSVAKVADGYFIVGSSDGTQGAYIIKTDLNGVSVKESFFGGANADLRGVVATPDGGCLAAGRTMNSSVPGFHGSDDLLLVKFASDGTIQWQKAFGGSGSDHAFAIIATADGGYAIAGQTSSTDGDITDPSSKSRAWVIKLDASENLQWQKTLTVNGSEDDIAYSIAEISVGSFAIAGRTLSFSGNADIWVSGFDQNSTLWTRVIGGSAGDVGFGITTSLNPLDGTTIDGYVATGYIGGDVVAVKLDNSGNTTWQKTYTGGIGRSVVSTSSGYVIVGNTGSRKGTIVIKQGNDDLFAVKIDLSGNQVSTNIFGGSGSDVGKSVIANGDGSFLAAGQTNSNSGDVSGNHGNNDAWLIKFKF